MTVKLRYNSFPSVKMSVKCILRSTYGAGITEITTGYQRCTEKISRFRNHVVFNARCKREEVSPESLRIRSPIDMEQGRRIAERAGQQFVNERLRLANYKLRQLEEEKKMERNRSETKSVS